MTREIALTRGYVALVDDEDFEHLSQWRWQARSARQDKTVYASRGEWVGDKKVTVFMHRVIMGAGAGQEIDHRNRDGLDNRRANLRFATRAQNTQNRSYSRARPGYRGVYPKDGGIRISIQQGRKQRFFHGFESEMQAAVAYDILARQEYGEFAVLNFSADRDWIIPVECPRAILERGRR